MQFSMQVPSNLLPGRKLRQQSINLSWHCSSDCISTTHNLHSTSFLGTASHNLGSWEFSPNVSQRVCLYQHKAILGFGCSGTRSIFYLVHRDIFLPILRGYRFLK